MRDDAARRAPPHRGRRALVVEDDGRAASALRRHLEAHELEVDLAGDGDAAWARLDRRGYDVVFTDLRLPDTDGIELIARLHSRQPTLPIIVTTAYATIESTVEALRCGAVDYLAKPFSPGHLDAILARTLPAAPAGAGHREASVPGPGGGERPMLGSSTAIRLALELADRVAASEVLVLVRGETGVGKELLARRIHARSARRAAPFVRFNCGNLAPELAEAQLFGSERGAYTSSVRQAPGVIEAAEGGTLFLDEIGELAPPLQVRLLDFLQDRSYRRLGSHLQRRADVRVIMATHRDLERMVEEGALRHDFYYRIRQVQITLPPLRARRDDLPGLVAGILARLAPGLELEPAAGALLESHPWPGNVRELEYALVAAVAMSPESRISAETMRRAMGLHGAAPEPAPKKAADAPGAPPPDAPLADVERWHIRRALEAHGGNVSATARALGVDRSTLQRKARSART